MTASNEDGGDKGREGDGDKKLDGGREKRRETTTQCRGNKKRVKEENKVGGKGAGDCDRHYLPHIHNPFPLPPPPPFPPSIRWGREGERGGGWENTPGYHLPGLG